eukprot:11757-Lingulodinium_polyedra.AAC.1
MSAVAACWRAADRQRVGFTVNASIVLATRSRGLRRDGFDPHVWGWPPAFARASFANVASAAGRPRRPLMCSPRNAGNPRCRDNA